MTAKRNENAHLPNIQPLKKSSVAVAIMCFLSLVATLLIVYASAGLQLPSVWDAIVNMGRALREHIGWGLSVWIAILISLYIATFSPIRIAHDANPARTYRIIGFISEAIPALVLPPVLLVAFSFIADPNSASALFFIIPIAAVVFLFAILLGRFEVADKSEMLRQAKLDQRWSESQRRKLKNFRRSDRITRATAIAVNAAIPSLVGSLVFLALSHDVHVTITVAVVALVCISANFMQASIVLIHVARNSLRARILQWLALISVVVAYTMTLLPIVDYTINGQLSIASGLLAALVWVSLSWALPPRPSPWTLRGLATDLSLGVLESSTEAATKRIEELSPPKRRVTLRQAIRNLIIATSSTE